ncbi:LANO_0H23200g1_1 [Lachancea nothofagi CBS 11611]|uniref:LANO_0H23200g1_1 n=1 Tax=Lachancea nothofagi CBS 11611 TaxID=1266666 RepID=A0A1G4KNY5_9SACH|nr:LANO_0H23200g1_1 [Lachancea nothofagi CBS 11611]
MSARFDAPGAGAPAKKASRFEQFRQTPAFPVLVNLSLFVAGIAFIQSPLMDMMAPQL